MDKNKEIYILRLPYQQIPLTINILEVHLA